MSDDVGITLTFNQHACVAAAMAAAVVELERSLAYWRSRGKVDSIARYERWLSEAQGAFQKLVPEPEVRDDLLALERQHAERAAAHIEESRNFWIRMASR